jgi:hypothetical protein
MIKHLATQTILYDGSQLSPLWAYRQFGVRGNSIIGFFGSANVDKHMVDVQDLRCDDFITSDMMLHFIVEIFNTPVDLLKAVLWQRILVSIVHGYADSVWGKKYVIEAYGDDIMVRPRARIKQELPKKLSVSIATVSPVSLLIHLAMNTEATGIPPRVRACALPFSSKHADDIMSQFTGTFSDICAQVDKVRPVV